MLDGEQRESRARRSGLTSSGRRSLLRYRGGAERPTDAGADRAPGRPSGPALVSDDAGVMLIELAIVFVISHPADTSYG